MILAIKDKIACFYNNKEEKQELLEMFKNKPHKIFVNSDDEYAMKFSNTDKISGFTTDEMNAFHIFKDLKEEGFQVASFELKNEEKGIYEQKEIVLNPIQYIVSDKRLTFSNRSRKLVNMTFSGTSYQSVNNFCAQIYAFSKETGESIERAAYIYFEEYKKVFSKYPWKTLNSSDIYSFSDKYIKLESFGDKVMELYTGDEMYNCVLKNEKNWKNLSMDLIKNIKVKNISIAIEDSSILKVIDEY